LRIGEVFSGDWGGKADGRGDQHAIHEMGSVAGGAGNLRAR
jgi:hypothetical protein